MDTVILVVHLMIAVALVGSVLLQRSEGGALGIGGGSGGGGLMSGRGAANMLTRTTAILAAAFFATSILLGILARQSSAPTSALDGVTNSQPGQSTPRGTVLDQLQRRAPATTPSAPATPTTPAAPTTPQVPQSQ